MTVACLCCTLSACNLIEITHNPPTFSFIECGGDFSLKEVENKVDQLTVWKIKKHREKETFSVWQMTACEWKYGSRESVCQISPGWGDVTLNNSLSYRTRIIETQSVSRVLPSTFSLHRFKRRPKLKWTTFTFISSTFFNELLWAVPFHRTSYYSFVARPNHYQQYSKVHWFSV